MEKAQTRTGLKVFATILDQVYETGKKVAQDFTLYFKLPKTITATNLTNSVIPLFK
jgi:hypothetical protein